jgi:hypothetical protein
MADAKPLVIKATEDDHNALRRLRAQLELQAGGRRVSMADALRFAVGSAQATLAAGETVAAEPPPVGPGTGAFRLTEPSSKTKPGRPRRTAT